MAIGLRFSPTLADMRKADLVHTSFIQPQFSRFLRKLHLKANLWHVQLAKLLLNPGFQAFRCFSTLRGENLCLRTGFGQLLLSLFLQLEQGIICHFNLFQFLSTSGEIGQHLLDRGTILLFQAVELIQAALYRVQFTGGKIGRLPAQIP